MLDQLKQEVLYHAKESYTAHEEYDSTAEQRLETLGCLLSRFEETQKGKPWRLLGDGSLRLPMEDGRFKEACPVSAIPGPNGEVAAVGDYLHHATMRLRKETTPMAAMSAVARNIATAADHPSYYLAGDYSPVRSKFLTTLRRFLLATVGLEERSL